MIRTFLPRLLKTCKHINTCSHWRTFSKVIDLNETTLTGRLLIHLNKSCHEYPGTGGLNLIRNDHPADIKSLNELLPLNESEKLRRLRNLDAIYTHDVKDMDVTVIFEILNLYMSLAPNRIVELLFYKSAMNHLNQYIQFLSLEEKIRFVFYVGLQKKSRDANRLLSQCLRSIPNEEIESLSIEDLCVVCNSTFKTSTRVENMVLLEKVISTINDNLVLLKDPAFFVTFVKTLRHNRYQNEDILNTISCTILFNATYELYNFSACCHILAIFADYEFYDEKILQVFYEQCVRLLGDSSVAPKRSYVDENIRPKDIKRFLWVFSTLGYSMGKEIIEGVIVPKILDRILNRDYNNDPESLLDSVFYLWMGNFQAVDLVPYCFAKESVHLIREEKSNSVQRLNLLLTCMQLENLTLYKQLQVKPENLQVFDMQLQISTRPQLQRVYNALMEIQADPNVDKFKYEVQIPNLRIVGITGFKKIYKKVFIEVLDEFVCVKNKPTSANGLMQLKLRLLEGMDQALIIVTKDEIEELTSEELKAYLESEIKMVL